MHLFFAKSIEKQQWLPWDRIQLIFIYRCDVIPFDMTGNNNDTGVTIDDKSNQWFGASISSSGDDGVIVVSRLLHQQQPHHQFIHYKNILLSIIIMMFITPS